MAEFAFSGTDLRVRLTNASTAAALDPSYVLTALFFDLLPDGPTLHKDNALLAPVTPFYPQSRVYVDNLAIDPQPAGGVVGGEWAYVAGQLAYNGNEGISSAGFGLFGPQENFPGNNLWGPVCVDGWQYGIVGPGGIATDAGGPVASLRDRPYIQNAVDFYLSSDVPLGDMTVANVVLQYGTSLADPYFIGLQVGTEPVIPEPLTIFGTFMGICGLGVYIRRRTRTV
jgi:hypothetical protein